MKKKADEYLYNEALKYLGKYPATKKKISEILEKKLRNKKIYQKIIFPENISKQELIENIVQKLDELKIINERHFIETVFHYYEQSLFSIKKIKNGIIFVFAWNHYKEILNKLKISCVIFNFFFAISKFSLFKIISIEFFSENCSINLLRFFEKEFSSFFL